MEFMQEATWFHKYKAAHVRFGLDIPQFFMQAMS